MLADEPPAASLRRRMSDLTAPLRADAHLGHAAALTAFWLLALVVLPYFPMFEFSFRPYLTDRQDRRAEGPLHARRTT